MNRVKIIEIQIFYLFYFQEKSGNVFPPRLNWAEETILSKWRIIANFRGRKMILILQLELAFAPQIIAMMIYLTTIIKLGVITTCSVLFFHRSLTYKPSSWLICPYFPTFILITPNLVWPHLWGWRYQSWCDVDFYP